MTPNTLLENLISVFKIDIVQSLNGQVNWLVLHRPEQCEGATNHVFSNCIFNPNHSRTVIYSPSLTAPCKRLPFLFIFVRATHFI